MRKGICGKKHPIRTIYAPINISHMPPTSISSNNKRIAKNTIALYFRQVLTMIVTLYTSRVILNTLGVVDFGIYNVVGGIVLMFNFLSSTMASASQRFLAIDLAKGDNGKLRQTFSLTILSYLIIVLVAVLLCETIAVWFLNTKMVIPEERIVAANWVLQFSILTFIVRLMTTPYLSVIIAHERMGIYAYMSIAEAVLKLLMVLLLVSIKWDKLIMYSALMFLVVFSINMFYRYYCKKRFRECTYSFFFDGRRLKEMFSFAGWNVLGAIANVLRSQGINIVLNLFFSPAINASRGIAYQVNAAISSFSNNFYTAVRPQIIKQYALGESDEMFKIIFYSSRLAYFLLFMISLPIIVQTESILTLWLKTPPEYTVVFVRLVVLNSLIEVINYPLVTGLQACGRIRAYQIFISVTYLSILPISYFLYCCNYPPETAMVVNIVVVAFSMIPRMAFCIKYLNLPIWDYIKDVVLRIVVVTLLSLIVYPVITYMNMSDLLTGLVFNTALCLIVSGAVVLFVGMSREERVKVYGIAKNFYNNYLNR